MTLGDIKPYTQFYYENAWCIMIGECGANMEFAYFDGLICEWQFAYMPKWTKI